MTPSKLGIISDTHGLVDETVRAVRLFREHDVQAIIHCGDIGSSEVVRAFQGIETHFVLGNMDGENATLRLVAEETGNQLHGWFGSMERADKRIAFAHGHLPQFEQEMESGNWDLLCFGHTHVASLQMHGSTMLLNPGAFKMVPHPTIAIVTLPEMTVERFDV
ncbi:MAG: YfcE family phosphodiesterase [Planctomycetaceae bacterium]|nr:YfcE family phosphodiesterase [Planctomycetaceae bacterium]